MTRGRILAALALAVVLSGAAPNADKEYEQGVKAYHVGDFVPAANHFYKVLQLRPNDPTLLSWYANALLGAGEQGKAMQVYRHILVVAPKSKAADQARQIMGQVTGSPLGLIPGIGLPARAPDTPLLEAYGHVLQELKDLSGYHTQVLALERGVIAAPDSIQAMKSLLAHAFNPRDGTLTAVGIGQGASEKLSLGAASLDATRWLATLTDWQAGRFTTSYADKKKFSGLGRVVAREKLDKGWTVVAMVAKVAAEAPAPSPPEAAVGP